MLRGVVSLFCVGVSGVWIMRVIQGGRVLANRFAPMVIVHSGLCVDKYVCMVDVQSVLCMESHKLEMFCGVL